MTLKRIGAVLATTVATAALLAGTGSAAHANPGIRYVGPSNHYVNPPEGVRCVQRVLGVDADGQFGDATYAAVMRFQVEHGVMADGIVGPATGDLVVLATEEADRFTCARFLPTTFILMDDDGDTAEGGTVHNRRADGDAGAAVSLGKPIGGCVVDGVKSHLTGPGRLAKVIWKRRLPTAAEWRKAPNPFLFTGGLLYCTLLK
ncbi:peptidoglycan-binding domain-containing protein [Paractinoplanes maris]|uniref:peptidoglycan-binding domain-containing protein n=1 Tax=Paractinoplanes maris TaxID=1734446 RepID=UPI002021FC5F|nr:peptidoglycan-binding protein [Actinoplanes maris]